MTGQLLNDNLILAAHQRTKERQYWLDKLGGELADCRFPVDFRQPPDQEGEMASAPFEIPEALRERLDKLSQKSGVRLFMVLAAGLTLLLNKYTGLKDIVIGAPVNRQVGEADYINTVIVLRSALTDDSTFKQLLQGMRDTAAGAWEHQNFPLAALHDHWQPQAKSNRPFPFRVALALEDIQETGYLHEADPELVFVFRTVEGKLTGELTYKKALFHPETPVRLGKQFVALMTSAIEQPHTEHAQLDWISNEERHLILHRYNDTFIDGYRDCTVVQLFDRQASAHPDALAVAGEHARLTYGQLKEQSERVASALRQRGIGPGHVVGLALERTPAMIVAMFGVMRSGAAYLPLSLNLPPQRVQEMVEDCASPLTLTESVLSELLNQDLTVPAYEGSPNDLVYVLYTSGSTGKPKGIMVEHRGLINFVQGMNRQCFNQYTTPRRFGLSNPFEFDASGQNLYGALLNGHSIHIVPEEVRVDGLKLLDFYRRHQVEVADGTPVHLRLLLEHVSERDGLYLKHFIVAGEALPPQLAKQFLDCFGKLRPQLTNAYGPTEATIDSACFQVEYDQLESYPVMPIGSPMVNQKLYVVGPHQQLQPIGVPGELCISGDGVARGYLNRPELTAEKFVPNPFRLLGSGIDERRMYCTGDLARWLPEGTLQYLGRMDDQIKIRGQRIELGEIESRLLVHALVIDAVLAVKKAPHDGEMHLCAYYIGEADIDSDTLRRFLGETLPYYMVPTYFVRTSRFPLSPNGKTDRKALPDPKWQLASAEYIPPRDVIEHTLTEIWVSVIGADLIGVHDSFFDLGGNSFQMTAIAAQIQRAFQVNLPFQLMFSRPTIAELSQAIREAEREQMPALLPLGDQTDYAVSSAQKRIFILNRFEGAGTAYNIPGVLQIEGEPSRERLEQTAKQILAQHEILRTSFSFVQGEPLQRIHVDPPFEIEYLEVAGEHEVDEQIQAFIRPFDITSAPLIRIGLISLQREKRHWLLFDLHHIAADGVSLSLLEEQFIRLYQGERLELPTVQYKDFALWQRERQQQPVYRKKLDYWLERLGGELPILQLPTDRPRPVIKSFAGDRLAVALPAGLSGELERFAAKQRVTLYTLLLSAYSVLLHRLTQQEDNIIGTPIAGRTHPDAAETIGMFVNTLAMRTKPRPEQRFISFLQETHAAVIDAFEHQEVQFEDIVEQVQVLRDTSRNPLFDTLLILQNIPRRTSAAASSIVFTPRPIRHRASKVDLTLEFHQEDSELRFDIEYATALYDASTIERMAGQYVRLLTDAVRQPERKLHELELLGLEEQEKVVGGFNRTTVDVPHNGLLHELLEQKAMESPHRPALVFGDATLTYGELNRLSNQWARRLRKQGIGREDKVGLLLPRSPEMVIAVFAVLKAGAAYVPLDPDYPAERIRFVLNDSGARLLLTVTELLELAAGTDTVLDLRQKEEIQTVEAGNLPAVTSPENLAYILYTSGSTGKPKGVMIEHAGIVNYLFAMQAYYPMTEQDAFLLKTPYTFDVSVLELFGWTLTGGYLVILEEGGHRNPRAILQAVNDHPVRLLNFVPSMFKLFLGAVGKNGGVFNKLRYLLLAGEALSQETVEAYYRLGVTAELHNLYGPTEATVIATAFPLASRGGYHSVPIGRPISNVRVYVLDPYGTLVPIGHPGELYIAGAGLARGYLSNEALTADRFLADPFHPGQRMYRTGDMVRWLADGQLEYFGRIDQQVKIRGFRIELGEIESLLLKYAGIAEAVVTERPDPLGNQQLVAFYTFNGQQFVDAAEVKTYLGRFLPGYMIPASLREIERLPLTASGKVDRQALPDPFGEQAEQPLLPIVMPRTEQETTLAALWSRVLQREEIGIDDDFFELGGNSLMAVELDLALESAGLAADDLAVYEHRTVRAMAEHIRQHGPTEEAE